MSLLVHSGTPDDRGVVLEVTPATAGWSYVGFRLVALRAGQGFNGCEAAREACIVVVTGTVDIEAGDKKFEAVGGRRTVFEGPPASVYLPADLAYRIVARGDAEVAICTAPGSRVGAPRLIAPDAVGQETRGTGTNTRYVRNVLDDKSDAESLLVVEVITPGGHWSSYPPHKHDRDAFPEETFLEETYYHRLSPPQGFAIQRVYTDDRAIDETMTVEDGDLVMVPRGYHPVGAPHGYNLYYLNVMAGPRHTWVFRNDPAHEWILDRRD